MHMDGLRTFRLDAHAIPESMIEIASKCRITKVSRAFPWICAYTARVERTNLRTGGDPLNTSRRERADMKIFFSKFASVTIFLIVIAAALTPAFRAQGLGTA